jgi:hypothetical protein
MGQATAHFPDQKLLGKVEEGEMAKARQDEGEKKRYSL